MAGKDHETINIVIQNIVNMHDEAVMKFVAPEKREAYLMFIAEKLRD